MATCTILILTYKGKHHLEFLLPTVKAAIDNYRGNAEIDVLIVDNGCDEITRQYSISNFPQFRYEFSPINDYLFSLNHFIREMKAEYLLMLNDDMKMELNVLNELVPMMENDPSLFAVSCRIMDFDGTYTASGVRMATYSKGWLRNYYLDTEESATKYSLYPGGGAAIFRTTYFNELEGFDTLFRPAYCEDTDLGMRAWQQGWKVVYHPKAILYHREGGTIKDQFKKDRLEQMIFKNQVLCMIKNCRYPGFLGWFLLLLPYRLLFNYFRNKNLYKAMIMALKQYSQAKGKRATAKVKVYDNEWMPLLNASYLFQVSKNERKEARESI